MLERVQNYGMRLILSKSPRTHSEELRQELGWTTLERRREVSRMKLMHRCVNRQVPSSIIDCIHYVTGIGNISRDPHYTYIFVAATPCWAFCKFQGSLSWKRGEKTLDFIKVTCYCRV